MGNRKNTFLLKRSSTPNKVPTSGQLLLGEIALNTADAKIYTSGTTANSILQIGWDRISRTGDTINGNFVFNGSISANTLQVNGSILGDSFKRLNGTSTQFLKADGSVDNSVFSLQSGINWTIRTSPADNQWFSVTYGNGLFVAVSFSGSGNRVMTSPDGINWTIRTSPADNQWSSVTYGNGLFVAVSYNGSGNRAMTSPDGINWTIRTSPADNQWYSVTYGNGLFVAVSFNGSGNRAMTSPDGINWTIRATPVDNAWRSVTYGNGLFVAVSFNGSGNRVMTSPDGINWTIRTTPADNNWFSVTYGNGLFVAVSATGSGNRVMTSPDGINWTSRATPVDTNWISVTYGNGLFVAVSNSGTNNRAMTSPDGINWTIRTTPVDNAWRSVTYGNGLFVAVSESGTNNIVMTSGEFNSDFKNQLDSKQNTLTNPITGIVTNNFIPKSNGSGGLINSNLSDTGTLVTSSVNLLVSGITVGAINQIPVLGINAGLSNTGILNGLISGTNAGADNSGSSIGGIIGLGSGRFNSGSFIGGLIGRDAGYENIGSNIGGFIGLNAGQYNTGGNIGGIIGHEAGQYNTANNFGVLIGYQAGRYNANANNVIGHNSHSIFAENVAGVKTFSSSDIDIITKYITITAHNFGTTNAYVNLKYNNVGGTAIGGLTNNTIIQVRIIDTNTIFVRTPNITTQGTGTHSLTPQFNYTNVNILGNNVNPTQNNQTIIGNTSTSQTRIYGSIDSARFGVRTLFNTATDDGINTIQVNGSARINGNTILTKVGVGTSTPIADLEVVTTATTAVKIRNINSGFANIDIESNRITGNLGGLRFFSSGDTSERFNFVSQVDGGFYFSNGNGITPTTKIFSILSNGNTIIGSGSTNDGINKLRVEGQTKVEGLTYTKGILYNGDLNNLTDAGFYNSTGSLSNSPITGSTYITVQRSSVNTDNLQQVVTPFLSNEIYSRVRINTVWQPWRKLITIPTTSYTVATLPAGSLNDIATVTDAVAPTYLGLLTGGGSIVTPVWHNGTNWVSR